MGLLLRNVEIVIKENDKKVVYKNFGEMLFMYFGVLGLFVLSGSRFIKKDKDYKLYIDLKFVLNLGELDKRV